MKIALVASAGGHFTQLIKLAKCWQPYEHFFVSSMSTVSKDFEADRKLYVVGECNRQHPLKVIRVLAKCAMIVLREKPRVVISTGAAPGCIVCLLCKCLGAKIVWIDSIANVERLSLSGRIIRPFADLILTQWPDLTAKYRNVYFAGTLI